MRHAIWLFLLLAGCGKAGDPLPPFIRIPEAVKNLAATQSGYNIILTWTNPPRNIDGSAATNLAHVQIRSNGAPVATVNVSKAGEAQSYAIPVGPAPSGERTFTLVVDTTQSKLSNISNAVSITPVQVPGSVGRLRATPDQRRIVLQWEKPQEHPELADAYIVTRTDVPGESQTVSDTRYEDTQYQTGKTFTYQVSPVRRVGETVITGVGPESFTVTVEDKTPPMVTRGLEIIQGYLTWDPNSETDLAGYRVFRSEHSDGGFMPISERLLTTNGFIDKGYRPGLYYAISAVDEFQNESPMSAPFRGP